MSFPAFFSVEEKLISYFFAEVAPLACWGNFTGVSRDQRSHAYL